MASRKDMKAQAREERLRKEAELAAKARLRKRAQLLGAIVTCAVVVVAAAVIISLGGSRNTPQLKADGSNVADVSGVAKMLAGIPQKGTTLGDSSAKVTINEYGDLQCPVCKDFTYNSLPAVIADLVRPGKATFVFHDWPIIRNSETDTSTSLSQEAGRAALAAAKQGRYYQFIETFYHNQGTESTGYIDQGFIDAIAKAVGLNVSELNTDMTDPAYTQEIAQNSSYAISNKLVGTPSFVITGPKGSEVITGNLATAQQIAADVAQVQ